jgi:uncharacterized membrane protein YgaE (UPF0421/DUF939 family)
MIVGLRVVKTVISIGISITLARLLHIEPAYFAGIVSMLAVQPSVYRSLHHSLSHIVSALGAAIIGITAALAFGNGVLVFAAVSLLVMALHVKLAQTSSLTVAVIVAINTIGTSDKLDGSTAAFYQFSLILIGMTVGTAVNVVLRPVHREREGMLLSKSEGMLRALLHFIRIDLQKGRMTLYKPDMKLQIEEVRTYINKGKAVSKLIQEDRWLNRSKADESQNMFLIYEKMLERIRDLVKALQKANLSDPESTHLLRVIRIVIKGQERLVKKGKRIPFMLHLGTLGVSRLTSNTEQQEMLSRYAYYQAYEALSEYLEELEACRLAVVGKSNQ